MKQIILVRHGESPFNNGRDYNRILSENGINKAFQVGETLKEFVNKN